ncbi:hypothetical protein UPYG_G00030840 [Umbra pygmaea]|uniref:TAFH domain-containing protein n=1 Tax=Umbra pygmaea TaxID=75934 RepID=A0ABD0XMU6_UMBPY
MPATETQKHEDTTALCIARPNGENTTTKSSANTSSTVLIAEASGQTMTQNAAISTLPVSVTQVVTTAAIAPVQANTRPATSSTTVKSIVSNSASKMMTTKGRSISHLVMNTRVPAPVVTVSARLSSPLGPALSRVATPTNNAVIAVPRVTSAQQPTASIRPQQTTSVQLPANFQIPPGMVLIRSDSGQLMLVSQQALAQAQGLAARTPSIGTSPRPPAIHVSSAAVVRKPETPAVIRALPPPSPHETPGQRAPLVKVTGAAPNPSTSQIQTSRPVTRPGPLIIPNKPTNTPKATPSTITPEVLENVKKCKNFLVTLIKLASSGTHSADMAKNVRELVKSLLDGRLEPEEFTDQLYRELKSSPQPYLVPFLKKSLPAVRQLTPNPQLFVQEVGQPKPQPPAVSKLPGHTPTLFSTNARPANLSIASGQPNKSTLPVFQQPGCVVYKPTGMSSGQARTYVSVQNSSLAKNMVVQSGQHHNTGAAARGTPLQVLPPPAQKQFFKDSVCSFRDEDDINDVASMAGVNLTEENAHILATNSQLVGSVVQSCCDEPFLDEDDINDVASMAGVNLTEENAHILATNSQLVGSVVQSCCDEPFLSPGPLHTLILHTGGVLGMSEVGSDVLSLVSQATQERLRDLLEKVTSVAQHRQLALKEDYRHVQTSDVRSQLRFLEELERLEKQRRDEEERETLLRIARSRSNAEDADQQILKQRAKELQQLELARLQHREANLTALAAIGPRRKRPLDSAVSQVGPGGSMSVQRTGVQRVTRVSLKDLLFCLEQDPFLRHSLALYKALLR